MLPAMVEQERREKLRRVSTEKLIHRVSDRVDASHHGPVLMPDEGPSKTSTLLAAGAISGGVSKLLTAPIDRIKIIYQVNTDPRHAFTLRRGFSTASSMLVMPLSLRVSITVRTCFQVSRRSPLMSSGLAGSAW